MEKVNDRGGTEVLEGQCVNTIVHSILKGPIFGEGFGGQR